MSARHTIVINGQQYDAITGLPVDSLHHALHTTAVHMDVVSSAALRTPSHSSAAIHRNPQHSTTLRRQHLQAPSSKVRSHAPVKHTTKHTDRSAMIAHFAAHPQPLPKNSQITIGTPVHSPAVTSAHHIASKVVQPQHVLAGFTKERHVKRTRPTTPAVHEITESVDRAPRQHKKPIRRFHLVTAAIALMLLSGYLTYINMPGLSVSVASSQAGVAAKYPSYKPDGYSFDGPVAYEPGQVQLRFKSNGGGQGYTIEQRASTWNSIALLDNYVNTASKGNYETISKKGVTIYTYDGNAAWTNGGVFYTITGDAPLNTDQLLRIADSM